MQTAWRKVEGTLLLAERTREGKRERPKYFSTPKLKETKVFLTINTQARNRIPALEPRVTSSWLLAKVTSPDSLARGFLPQLYLKLTEYSIGAVTTRKRMPRSYPKLGAVFFYLALLLELVIADGGGHRDSRENGIGYLGNGRDGIDRNIRGRDRSSASYSVGDEKR